MNTLIRHYGKIVNSKMIFYNKELLDNSVLQLNGREFELVIKEKSKRASTDQFGYYRGGILGTCHETEMFSHFNGRDEIHENYFAPLFLSYKVMVELPGKKYELTKVRSLADLTMKEFAEFITRVIAHCESELGIAIANSEDYYITKYKTIKG